MNSPSPASSPALDAKVPAGAIADKRQNHKFSMKVGNPIISICSPSNSNQALNLSQEHKHGSPNRHRQHI